MEVIGVGRSCFSGVIVARYRSHVRAFLPLTPETPDQKINKAIDERSP